MQVIETLDETTARSEWHKAVAEFGLSNCKVERVEVEGGSPIFRITVQQ